jgi:predicted 3-demethylubiquinone-9 3-methyltransferase (glyoxalase superfamily)
MTSFDTAPRITPFLWFDANAEEAVNYYLSVFKNSRRLGNFKSDLAPDTPKGKPLTVSFELEGQRFTALNGGPHFKFTEAISFMIRCDSQQEIDYYWSKLQADPNGGQCGWAKDQFGLSWQIVPGNISDLLKPPKAFQAMMKMKKLDIAELERAGKE